MNQIRLGKTDILPDAVRGLLSVVLALCILIFSAGCEKAPVEPVNISSNDVCYYCKSPIIDLQYAAEFITNDGFVRKFDDFSCLMESARKVGRKKISAFYVMDVRSKTLVPAEQVQFVRCENVPTPRQSGIVAFKDASTAESFAASSSGKLVTLSDLLE
ncbi:MAG: hypothetical protein GXX84_12585 [Acidobacteria bacterium]|nr:hypothetical protein [Acidobacteriota bacterium]